MMPCSLDTFLQHLPQWVEVIDASDAPVSVVVRTDVIGTEIGRIDLLLKQAPAEPSVEELNSKTKQLPDFCLERHIMRDRTFCLGHIEGASKLNNLEVFWCKLRAFLDNQDFATRFGVWPIEQGMSHSEISMKAQKHIEDMIRSDESLLQEWLLSAFRGRGWISRVTHRGSSRSTPTYTARQECPRGCSTRNPHHAGCQFGQPTKKTKKAKQDRPILMSGCKSPDLINKLLMLEHIRWSADRLLHESIPKQAKQISACCRTMKTCPLTAGT